MKRFLIVALFITIFACKKEDNSGEAPITTAVSISGKAQKGPYVNGSPITIFELDNSLAQTGQSYSTTINDDAGNFSLNNISLSTGYGLITANGYYFMEHFNLVSTNQLYLEAVSDINSNSVINVNLLTHIIKPRIETLVASGSSFSSARDQAQNELKSFLGVTSGSNTNFEQLEVSNDAFLFAVSLLFQRKAPAFTLSYNYTSELSSLLNKFRNDFKDNGQIDSTATIDTLVYNANRIELLDAKENLEIYMSSLGASCSVTGYEQYIYAFQKLYSDQIFTNILFPDSAFYQETGSSVNSFKRNVLYEPSVNFQSGTAPYLLAAIVPCDSSLKITFTLLSTDLYQYSSGGQSYGWKRTAFNGGGGFTLESQGKNYQSAMLIYLLSGTGQPHSARIEYFLNGNIVPYFSKVIYW